MAGLTYDLPLHEMTCGSCSAKPTAKHAPGLDYLIVEVPGEEDDQPTVPVDVKALSFTETAPGRLAVSATLSLPCVDCGTPTTLQRVLETPTLLVRDNVHCARGHELRPLGQRSYRFNDSAETGPVLEVTGEWACDICADLVLAATIAAPLPPDTLAAAHAPVELNATLHGGRMQIILGAGSVQNIEYYLASAEDLSRALDDLARAVGSSDLPADERAQIVDALEWCADAADLPARPPDAEEKVRPLRAAAGWLGGRLTAIIDAATGALVEHWLIRMLGPG
jgi:hypothetical protein